jgi:hypothetical protein
MGEKKNINQSLQYISFTPEMNLAKPSDKLFEMSVCRYSDNYANDNFCWLIGGGNVAND